MAKVTFTDFNVPQEFITFPRLLAYAQHKIKRNSDKQDAIMHAVVICKRQIDANESSEHNECRIAKDEIDFITTGKRFKKMDWLRLENRIRNILREYYRSNLSAEDALTEIDGIMGEETGRGYESDFNFPVYERSII